MSKSRTRFVLAAISSLACLGAAGCQPFDPKALQGDYLGTWNREGVAEATPVRAHVDVPSGGTAEAAVRCASGNAPCDWTLRLESAGKRNVNLFAPGFLAGPSLLEWRGEKSRRPCVSALESPARSEVCATGDGWIVSFTDADGKRNVLSFIKQDPGAERYVRDFETPRPYTLDQLLTKAYARDFSTRIEYQRYLEFRYNAKATLLAQLPHVNLGTVANILGGSVSAVLQTAGDLLPFLLPNRWLQVREASHQSDAEYAAFVAIRLNAVAFTEVLAYSYLRDSKILQSLRAQRGPIEAVYSDLVKRERLGQLPADYSLDILAILNGIDQTLLQLESLRDQELANLALSAGFANPKAILTLTVSPNGATADKRSFPLADLEKAAMQNAPEIRQADALLAAAREGKVERAFSWLDPSASPTLSLGAALIPSAKVGQAQIDEVLAIREQIRASLVNKAALLQSGIVATQKVARVMRQSLGIQAGRLKRIREELDFGTNFVLADLVGALQDQVQAEVSQIGNEALYWADLAQIQRLTCSGNYLKLAAEADDRKVPTDESNAPKGEPKAVRNDAKARTSAPTRP